MADLAVVIDTLLVDLGERFQQREPRVWFGADEPPFDAERRAEDVAAIRGYIRAIRVLRGEFCPWCANDLIGGGK